MKTHRRPLWIAVAAALGATVAFSSIVFAGHSVRSVVNPNAA